MYVGSRSTCLYIRFLHAGQWYLIFYPGIENLILPMLFYTGRRVTSSCEINKYINTNSGEQEKESTFRVRVGQKNPSLGITVCQHSASLVMPNGDPREGFCYPTLNDRFLYSPEIITR